MRISDWSSEVCSSDLTSAEIDIVEYYGRRPDIYMSSSHVWRKSAPPTSVTRPTTAPWKCALEEGFHTYGVLITPEKTRFYLDRKFSWETATPPDHRQPIINTITPSLASDWKKDTQPRPKHNTADDSR